MPTDPHPPTEAPELTWDHELSQWVPAYRQTRWDTAVEPHCRCTDPACTAVTHYYGDPVPPAGPGLDPLERRIAAAILTAYLVPGDVLPAMVERVADAVRPDAPAEREEPTWLLNLVHAAETAADEIACNGDHEGNDGCDGCAWVGLIESVPVRLRNAADEHASKGGAW